MVQLRPMGAEDFQHYLDQAVQEYAQEHVAAGNWSAARALELSAQAYQKLLPQGHNTPDNYLYQIQDSSVPPIDVGTLWFAVTDFGGGRQAFLYDFLIYEPYRRHGFGLEALQALEEKVSELGLNTIGLHVFGHNHAARSLYEKAGYQVTDLQMTRRIR